LYLAFYVGGFAGAVLGSRIPDPTRLGLDFVFPAVFIAIVAPALRVRWQWLVAGLAALIALPVAWRVGGTWHIALAGLGASALGIWLAPDQVLSGRKSPE
jgi:predicted branched-subunit amino acid permease